MKKHIGIFLVFFLTFLTPLSVFAESGKNSDNSNRGSLISERSEGLKEKAEEVKEKIASRTALLKEKLEDKKLQVCENRQDQVKKRSQQTAERAERQLNNFSAIAERVDNFYSNKLIPRGVTVASYSALKANIAAKKLVVKNLVDTAKTDANNFNCKGDDPKGQLANFKTDIKNIIIALKEFRTSIRNFIVVIRTASAQKEASGSADIGN